MRLPVDTKDKKKEEKSLFVQKKRSHTPWFLGLENRGLLVLVTGARKPETDVVIAAARRRYLGDPILEFPGHFTTKTSEQDSEHISVARRVFHSIAARKGFVVAWKHDNISYGFTAGSFLALEAGRIVVLAIPPDAVAEFKNVWPRIEIIPIASDVDKSRPQTRVWRSFSAAACPSPFVSHSGDLAEALRKLLLRLDSLRKVHLKVSP